MQSSFLKKFILQKKSVFVISEHFIYIADYYKQKNIKIESKGQRYEMGDFIIKIGSVVFGQSATFKGVLVEVRDFVCSFRKNYFTKHHAKLILSTFCTLSLQDKAKHE